MSADNKDHLRALHAAYVEVTGLRVSFSPERERTLRQFDRRGFTPEDVRAVLLRLKGLVGRGVKGYTGASLDWRNAMGDVDIFEERKLKLDQDRLRRLGEKREAAAGVPRPRTARLPEGGTVSILATPAAAPGDAAPIGGLVKAVEAEIRKGRKG